MFHIILYEPEIPPNTGNIIRLCANTGVGLHLVHPLGFTLEDRQLRRAGLDYHEWAEVRTHASLSDCLRTLGQPRLLAFSTHGERHYSAIAYQPGDALLFGPETRGLPTGVLATIPAQHRLRLPMRGTSRSLNLANTVAIAVYEACRQQGFPGMD